MRKAPRHAIQKTGNYFQLRPINIIHIYKEKENSKEKVQTKQTF